MEIFSTRNGMPIDRNQAVRYVPAGTGADSVSDSISVGTGSEPGSVMHFVSFTMAEQQGGLKADMKALSAVQAGAASSLGSHMLCGALGETIGGLSCQAPCRSGENTSEGCLPESPERGYRSEISSLMPGEPHTIENIDAYLADNLGDETIKEIREGKKPFVIFQGEGSQVFSHMEEKGWKILHYVDKREGFHQVCAMENDRNEQFYALARVNGEDRILHMQSLLKLAGLQEERVSTMGHYAPYKEEYLKTFRKIGHVPDYVVYGLGKTAALALLTIRPLSNALEIGDTVLHSKSKRNPEKKEKRHDISGLSMQVMELKNGKHIWFLPPLYGDLTVDMKDALLEHGARNISFMGTMGAVNPHFQVNQIVTPTERIHADGSREKLTWLAPSPQATPCSYMRVATPNIETQQWAKESRERGVDAIEVELGYWLDSLKDRPEVKFNVQNVVSDVIQGENHSDMTKWSTLNNLQILNRVKNVLLPAMNLRRREMVAENLVDVPLMQDKETVERPQ